jgi:hypothetical protein
MSPYFAGRGTSALVKSLAKGFSYKDMDEFACSGLLDFMKAYYNVSLEIPHFGFHESSALTTDQR